MIEIQVSCLIFVYLFIYYVLNFRLKLTEASLYYCSSKVIFFIGKQKKKHLLVVLKCI